MDLADFATAHVSQQPLQAGSLHRRAGDTIIHGIQEAALRLFTTALEGAGISAQSFLDTLQRVGDMAGAVINNASTIATNLISGVEAGVKGFFGNIGDHLKDWLFSWLFGKAHINLDLLPKKWNDWDGWIAFLADLVGLSWDKILGTVQSVFGQEIELVLQLYDKIAGLVDKGWSGVAEWLQQVGRELSEKLFSVGEITTEIIDAVKTGLLKTAIDLVVDWAKKLNPAGGLVAAVQAIYKVVKWVVDNRDKLQKLAESVIQGVQALVNGSGVEKVAEYVEKGLASAFTAAADFILSFFHLDAIPKTIRQVSDKWVDIVPRKLAELLGRLKGALLEQLQKLWGGYWGRAEWTAGNEKHKIWVDFRSGKVLMASTEQEPSAYVKDLRRRAAKNEKAATAAGKAADALAVAEKTAGEIQSATARAANRGASESERATAVKAARSASAKAQESLREFAKDAGEAEKALGSSCSLGTRHQEKQAGCWRKGTLCRGGDGGARAIEEQRLGRRVGTLPQAEHARAMAPRLEIDPALWCEVFLVQDDVDNGGVVSMALLRPLEWVEQHCVELGAWVALDLPEMGVHGETLVTAVQPCPEIEEGEGGLVTGTFRRSKALVLELKVSGESDVLGVTGNHLVWSEDRQDWVAVKDLCVGERLCAWDGSTPAVESLTACQEPEPVYNLEVESDHCYRVGQQGLLVHNASAPCLCPAEWQVPTAAGANYRPTFVDRPYKLD